MIVALDVACNHAYKRACFISYRTQTRTMDSFNTIQQCLLDIAKTTHLRLNFNISCYALQRRCIYRAIDGPIQQYGKPVSMIPVPNIIPYIKHYGIRITFFVSNMAEFLSYEHIMRSIVSTWRTINPVFSFPKYLRIGCIINNSYFLAAWMGENWDSWRSDPGCSSMLYEFEFMSFLTKSANDIIKNWTNVYKSWDRMALAKWNETGM